MNDIDQFLREAVFYPCSDLDGLPVKRLATRFNRFFYADYSSSITRAAFDHECQNRGFRGYRNTSTADLDVQLVFQDSWDGVRQTYLRGRFRLPFEWVDPFVAGAHFQRTADYAEDHGPVQFQLIFARCEAITTLRCVFNKRSFPPRCVAYIRPGIGFGGNRPEFPGELERALRENAGGLPEFLLYDEMSSDPKYGDYLRLVENYEPIQQWGEFHGPGNVTLARLKQN
jgi:hypothetical protein